MRTSFCRDAMSSGLVRTMDSSGKKTGEAGYHDPPDGRPVSRNMTGFS